MKLGTETINEPTHYSMGRFVSQQQDRGDDAEIRGYVPHIDRRPVRTP